MESGWMEANSFDWEMTHVPVSQVALAVCSFLFIFCVFSPSVSSVLSDNSVKQAWTLCRKQSRWVCYFVLHSSWACNLPVPEIGCIIDAVMNDKAWQCLLVVVLNSYLTWWWNHFFLPWERLCLSGFFAVLSLRSCTKRYYLCVMLLCSCWQTWIHF